MPFQKLCILYLRVILFNTNKILLISFYFLTFSVAGDSFTYNSYNNHGALGLINMPSARFYNESVHGLTIYDGTPDRKITLTSSPFNWMEASFFYTSLQNRRYCAPDFDPVCKQSYKDKGFNIKFRLKEEGFLPAIAIGLNDLAGTGLYSSEYIVGSYGKNNIDIHFGLGYGTMNQLKNSINNPFGYLSDSFKNRPIPTADYRGKNKGGKFEPNRYFSGEKVSPFYGISYSLNKKILIKFERDTTSYDSNINYELPASDYSFGIDFSLNNNFSVGISYERGIYTALKFIYKNNPQSSVKTYHYKKAPNNEYGTKYSKFIKNLQENGIGVNKIAETATSIGVELTQVVHPNIG